MTLKLHRMQLPREVVVGRGTLDLVGDICKKLGFSKTAFVVTGEKTVEIAGNRVIELLESAGMKVRHILVSSPTLWNVRAVEMKIKIRRPQLVLGEAEEQRLMLQSSVQRVAEYPILAFQQRRPMMG
ncbi:MAG TPA: hypothetical protein VK487_12215 [Candidatus Bathyarchaeia archaeon]|nr:hypothetical protein [Candidatus Bathyarchaeia archaeon]